MSAKAILSASVSEPPAVYVEDVFSTFLYTGNGGTQTITNGIDLAGEGGLVWIKNRGEVVQHSLFDTQRGINKLLSSNLTDQQSNLSSSDLALNATSTGFAFGSDAQYYPLLLSGSGKNFCSWTFRKEPKFFDVVTYTGNGAVGRQLSHSLGSTPGCIFVKCTSDSGTPWIVYHRSIVSTGWLELASTTAVRDYGAGSGLVPFGTMTSTYATLYDPFTETNATAKTYVAYLFAHDAGGFGDAGTGNVISCGSYTGAYPSTVNVTLGYEPQWILVKNATQASDWFIYDVMRGMSYSSPDFSLAPNSTAIENGASGAATSFDPTPTGFIVDSGLTAVNASGNTHIYIAIRRGPMKTPESGTEVFNVATLLDTGTAVVNTGFPIDLGIDAIRTGSVNNSFVWDRLRGGPNYLRTSTTAAELSSGGSSLVFDLSESTQLKIGSGENSVLWTFRRAPGFFDVVAYTGNGSTATRTIPHSLGVRPEMVILKRRDVSVNWLASVAAPDQKILMLNSTNSSSDSANFFNGELLNNIAYANASVFSVSGLYSNNISGINASAGTYIAYLFASCPGVSKVGNYTGTGTGYTVNVNCGFTTGARFVLIKRTDSTGDWFVWDTARGIISGNDPYLLLNSAAAEATGTDYIDPLSTGFQISSTAPAAINASGGNFIFLAIA